MDTTINGAVRRHNRMRDYPPVRRMPESSFSQRQAYVPKRIMANTENAWESKHALKGGYGTNGTATPVNGAEPLLMRRSYMLDGDGDTASGRIDATEYGYDKPIQFERANMTLEDTTCRYNDAQSEKSGRPNETGKMKYTDDETGRKGNRPQEPSALRELGSLVIKVAMIAGIAALIFTFMYGFHYNVDPSMNPSVKDGDLVLYYRLDKDYRAGDLLLTTFQGKDQVRRVVATAGDIVDITEEGLIINGALQQEPGIYQQTKRYADGTDFPLTIREDEVFILADAREDATDSRVYGAVNIRDTRGTVITILRRRSL